jgi:hypothetical protein
MNRDDYLQTSRTHAKLSEGYKIMGPEDVSFVNEMALLDKVDRILVSDIVSCTNYEAHKTPVTFNYDLVMYRVKP